MNSIQRRTLIKMLGAGVAASIVPLRGNTQSSNTQINAESHAHINSQNDTSTGARKTSNLIKKQIPSSGEAITVIGMGTWQTFNVGGDTQLRDERTLVLKAFFDGGGQLVDSSPMYGSSQEVMGYALGKLGRPGQLFSAEKVWTIEGSEASQQIAATAKAWQVTRFDLMQVHNLLNWRQHLNTLRAMKEAGKLRYIGITTSHGRRLGEFERIMQSQPLDFVQLTYNIEDRWAEERLLPLAKEKGIAVIANRPFGGGALVDYFQSRNKPLPKWAKEIHCTTWPQFLLRFIVSHPAVTCAIPATTRVEHMKENISAAQDELPDEKMRQQMLNYIRDL